MKAKAKEHSADSVAARATRVLLVEDHALVRRGMSELIEQEPDLAICGEADDAPSAFQMIAKLLPDVVVVDLTLKEGSGIELIKQAKASFPNIKFLVASMHDEKVYAERVLSAGAMGYVSKQDPADTIIEAIRRILKGRVYLSDRMADRVLHRLVDGHEAVETSSVESLSDRELQVFEMMGRGMPPREIAEKLHLSTKTIDTYRQRIKEKLNLASGHEVMRHAMQWALEQR